jgi:hypothetical protein
MTKIAEEQEVTVNVYKRQCSLCGVRTGRLSAHLKTSHIVGGLPCGYCSCTFESSVGRAIHRRQVHPELNVRRKKNGKSSGLMSRQLLKKSALRLRSQPRLEARKPKGSKCGLCGITTKSIKAHLERSHVPGGIPCKSCPCTFRSAASRISHRNMVHKEENNWPCRKSFCVFVGKTEDALIIHKRVCSFVHLYF